MPSAFSIDRLANAEMGPMLILGIILIAGTIGGWLARKLHVPSVTGNILAGVIIGPIGIDLFHGLPLSESLQPLSTFAMGLIAMSVGSQLSYQRIHNALRRIFTITLGEALGTLILVTLSARLLGLSWPVAFVLGCISTETAPATTFALIRETRAKGPFVKTLLSLVALDNMLCITLFAFSTTLLANSFLVETQTGGLLWALGRTGWQVSGSLLLGLLLGAATERLVHRAHVHDFSVVFVAVLLSVGLSNHFQLSPLLTSLCFGIYLGNASEEAARQSRALEPIELLLFSCFFTLAGASVHLDLLFEAGLFCAAYLIARFIGKFAGATLGALAARTTPRIYNNIGLAMVPEAGVSVGLVVLLNGDPNIPTETSEFIGTIVLAAVAINEIIGPFFTRLALSRANEVNKDRRRLIEFLQEEYILTNLEATDKWDALRKLTDFYCRTHKVPAAARPELLQTIEEREKEFSTAIGRGTAIPHGRIEEGAGIRGILATCPAGVDFDAPDGKPVTLLMLVVTPRGYEREHLEVMASLAQMISDEAIRTRLIAAINPNDAWEVIESEEARNYNYFLDEANSSEEERDSGTAPAKAAPLHGADRNTL